VANDAMRTYWNEVSGPEWVRLEDEFERALAPIAIELLRRIAPTAGEHVLDVGCGLGTTTLPLARAVGPAGRVMGLDLSRPMLARARQRAEQEGLANIIWREADAQDATLPGGHFDAVVSRLGVMFFDDPAAAFANLAAATKAGGRLCFACWQPAVHNDWYTLPSRILEAHVVLPPTPPSAAGPFAFGDPDRLRDLLCGAGFEEPTVDPLEFPMVQGGSRGLDGALDHMVRGPIAEALRSAPAAARQTGLDALRAAVAAHLHDGEVRFPAAAWIVGARRPS